MEGSEDPCPYWFSVACAAIAAFRLSAGATERIQVAPSWSLMGFRDQHQTVTYLTKVLAKAKRVFHFSVGRENTTFDYTGMKRDPFWYLFSPSSIRPNIHAYLHGITK